MKKSKFVYIETGHKAFIFPAPENAVELPDRPDGKTQPIPDQYVSRCNPYNRCWWVDIISGYGVKTPNGNYKVFTTKREAEACLKQLLKKATFTKNTIGTI